jgi:hypothetical protein
MDSDKLHSVASVYANMRKALFEEASEKSPGPPRILAMYQWIWLAHYEGFRSGYEAGQRERQDEH